MARAPVCIISLPDDDRNYRELAESLQQSPYFQVMKITGVLGRALPNSLCLALTHDLNSVNYKGTLGCFLSHVRAWEIIASSESSMGIVLEDDVVCNDLEDLLTQRLPADFEIIFFNDRVSLNADAEGELFEFDRLAKIDPLYHLDHSLFAQVYAKTCDTQSHYRNLSFIDISASLNKIEKNGQSVGGDGYLLSRHAARKLLNFIESDGYFSHVDMRLLAYCMTPELIFDSLPGEVVSEISNILKVVGRSKRLIGYSTYPPLVTHKNWPSRRAHQDQLGRVLEV